MKSGENSWDQVEGVFHTIFWFWNLDSQQKSSRIMPVELRTGRLFVVVYCDESGFIIHSTDTYWTPIMQGLCSGVWYGDCQAQLGLLKKKITASKTTDWEMRRWAWLLRTEFGTAWLKLWAICPTWWMIKESIQPFRRSLRE
jgi:hypothetical protein